MRIQHTFLFLLLPLLFLASCVTVIPERFDANIKFLGTYGYVEYNFRGNVLVADAAINVQNKNTTQAEADEIMREAEQSILDDDRNAMGDRQFKHLKYIGNNRFSAEHQIKSSFVEDLSYFQSAKDPVFVKITENETPDDPKYFGEYTIEAFDFDENTRGKMSQLKLRQNGTFSIETDCRVLGHNAQMVVRNGRNYIYTWYISGKENKPPTLTLRAQVPQSTRH